MSQIRGKLEQRPAQVQTRGLDARPRALAHTCCAHSSTPHSTAPHRTTRPHHARRETQSSNLPNSHPRSSRPTLGWGNNLDAARAHVVLNFSHYYWPLEKVDVWLHERWPVWCRDPPPWFTPHWRRELVKLAPPTASIIPAEAYEHIRRDENLARNYLRERRHADAHLLVAVSAVAGGQLDHPDL